MARCPNPLCAYDLHTLDDGREVCFNCSHLTHHKKYFIRNYKAHTFSFLSGVVTITLFLCALLPFIVSFMFFFQGGTP